MMGQAEDSGPSERRDSGRGRDRQRPASRDRRGAERATHDPRDRPQLSSGWLLRRGGRAGGEEGMMPSPGKAERRASPSERRFR